MRKDTAMGHLRHCLVALRRRKALLPVRWSTKVFDEVGWQHWQAVREHVAIYHGG